MPRLAEHPAQAFITKLMCDCGEEMEYTPSYTVTETDRYLHKCPKCGVRYNAKNKIYPCMEYKQIPIDSELLPN